MAPEGTSENEITLNFASDDLALESFFGLPSFGLGSLNFDIFDASFAPFSSVFSSLPLDFDFTFGGISTGLDIALDFPTLGNLQTTQITDADFFLPDTILEGDTATFGTLSTFQTTNTVLDGNSVGIGGLELNLDIATGTSSLSGISLGNAFGTSLIDLSALDGLLTVPGFTATDIPLISLSDIGVSGEIPTSLVDGVEGSIILPNGEAGTQPGGVDDVGAFDTTVLSINESIAAISVNVAEALDNFGPLAALDLLSEDFGPFGLDIPVVGPVEAEFGFTIVAPSASLGLDLVQTFSFTPTDIVTTFTVEEEVQEGSIGSAFDFTIPVLDDGTLDGSVAFDLLGDFTTSLSIVPTGTFGIDAIAGNVSVSASSLSESIDFGPLISEATPSLIPTSGFELFNASVSVDAGFFETVVEEFSIPTNIGQDIAFVIDTTGSIADDIDMIQAQAADIITAIFGPEDVPLDARVAVVGFNDPSTEVVLPFTDQPSIEAREQAALDAINSLSASGGGDTPEAVFSGLLTALDGSIGEFREEATARRIILFGDAPANDEELADTVFALAANLNADIEDMIDIDEPEGSEWFSTFGEFSVESSAFFSAGVDSDDPSKSEGEFSDSGVSVASLTTTVFDAETETEVVLPVQIFTVAVGSSPSALALFEEIAETTGGAAFTAADASEVVDTLLEVLTLPIYTISSSVDTIEEGDTGTQTIEFTVSRDNAANEATVEIGLAGTVDGIDIGAVPTSVFFEAGQTEAIISVTVNGDALIEPDETLTLEIVSVSEPSTIGVASATTTIVNDDLVEAEDQVLIGTDADDVLVAGVGDDQIIGNLGSDTIVGLAGDDVLTGDTADGDNNTFDQDIFVFGDVDVVDNGNDTITDFDTNNLNGGENNFDTLTFNFGGESFSLATGQEFLGFVNVIESDGNADTDALVFDDDLVFAFQRNRIGEITDSIRLNDVVGDDGLSVANLTTQSADFISESDAIFVS